MRNLLFENISSNTLEDIEILIKEALRNYFPQLIVTDLQLENQADYNIVEFKLKFRIVGTRIEDEIQINFE